MPNILDDTFQWAAGEPSGHTISVQIAITTNELTRSNLVSFAEGPLFYHPARATGMFFAPASFASNDDGLTQYFSDRRYGDYKPFDAGASDPLTVSITRPHTIPLQYAITLKSSKWGLTASFTPNFDAASGVIYGSVAGGLVTVSLCNRASYPRT
jgi:hypothetical protein